MGEELLVREQIDAGGEFVREFNDYLPVSVAFWIRPAESENLFLYIASDGIDDGNIDVAYREVVRRLASHRKQWLDPFQVKLVSSSDPIARDAAEIRDRSPAPLATHFHGTSIGGLAVDGVYIYPPVAAMNAAP